MTIDDLVVCHVGHGTLMRALTSGVPVVACPAAGDMNENAARADWAGVGVRLPVLLLILGVLVSGVAVWAPAADQRSSSERSYTLTRGAQKMLTAMLDQETGLRGYILTADRRFLEPYRAGRANVARSSARSSARRPATRR